jgi:hypothetical protein
VSSWHREASVAARADAILADAGTAKAYTRHFEAQLRMTRFRAARRQSLLVLLRVLRRPDVILLAVLGFAATSPAAEPHVGQAPS